MARNKRNEERILSAEAVRAAGEALMGLIHPHCELRMTEDGTACEVTTHSPTAKLLVAVAGRAALSVVRNSSWYDDSLHSCDEDTIVQARAANLLGIPREARTPVVMHVADIAADRIIGTVIKLFVLTWCRKALAKLALRYEQGSKPSADDIAVLVGKCLPSEETIRRDVGSVYIRLGWTLN